MLLLLSYCVMIVDPIGCSLLNGIFIINNICEKWKVFILYVCWTPQHHITLLDAVLTALHGHCNFWCNTWISANQENVGQYTWISRPRERAKFTQIGIITRELREKIVDSLKAWMQAGLAIALSLKISNEMHQYLRVETQKLETETVK